VEGDALGSFMVYTQKVRGSSPRPPTRESTTYSLVHAAHGFLDRYWSKNLVHFVGRPSGAGLSPPRWASQPVAEQPALEIREGSR